MSRLLTEQQVSELFGFKLSTLRSWRYRGIGLPFLKIKSSSMVRYREADIERFLESCRTSTSPDKAPEVGR